MRRQLLIRSLALTVLPAVIIFGCNRPSKPWSVLVLTVDTLRPDYMSANSYPLPTTPYLDSLIEEGFYFDEAVSPIARTTPALASLMTGAYPHTTGVRTLTDSLREEVVPVAEIFREAGHQTLAVVTNRLVPPKRRLNRGFDVYDWKGDTRTAEQTTDRALELLGQLNPEFPVFLWVHYIDPHVPYHSTRELAERFDPDYDGRFRHNFGWQPQPGQSRKTFRPFPEELPKAVATHGNPLPEEVNEHIRRLYAADIRFFDDQVGRLVDQVRARYGDSLIIVFAADHGESLGEHDYFFDHGDYTYNAGLRIPLGYRSTVQAPALRLGALSRLGLPGGRRPHPFRSFGPGGSRGGQWADGGSLARPLPRGRESGGPAGLRREWTLLLLRPCRPEGSETMWTVAFRAVILDGWKLVLTPFLPDEEAWELFDLRRDPHEEENLFRDDHPSSDVSAPISGSGWKEVGRTETPRPLSRLRPTIRRPCAPSAISND